LGGAAEYSNERGDDIIMSFCPVCGAHHDPEMPCADRAGELLRNIGISPAPMGKKDLNKTIKKANRSLVVLLIVVLSLFLLSILISYFNIASSETIVFAIADAILPTS
jgi:predicted nucleic acid-binding Zn ribbon protein